MRSGIIIVDDFYEDPDAVRDFALKMNFNSAGKMNYPGWQSGKSLSSESLKESFSSLIGRPIEIDPSTFFWGGFRLVTKETGRLTKVHADVSVDWAAMVYLTRDAPMEAGTGFYRHREYEVEGPPTDEEARGMGFASSDEFDRQVARRDMADPGRWELVSQVGPVYNRLVLFRGADLYHAPMGGVGSGPESARLTHNFFFNEVKENSAVGHMNS